MAFMNLRMEGDPILRKKSRPVKEINSRIRKVLDDMVETMYKEEGVGLAAPQIGKLRRMVVIDVGQGPIKMINPEIISRSEEMEEDVEGCLSLPGFNGTVLRPEEVRLRYTDEEGEDHEVEAQGLFARCICHEIDHLDGVLFRDRVLKEINLSDPTQDQVDYLKDHGILQENLRLDESPKSQAEEE